MPYSAFNLKRVTQQFGLTETVQDGYFGQLPLHALRAEFVDLLAETVPLATAINTEKVRSELIVTNVLLELRRTFDQQISFFSGVEFDADSAAGLTGFCDFLVSLSPRQLFITAPVITLVEAKNDNLPAGLGQCIAEMLGAQRFNAAENQPVARIYGTVTSGGEWLFARLEGNQLLLDLQEYSIRHPSQIMGILAAMVRQAA